MRMTYKVRTYGGGKDYSIGLPQDLARRMVEAGITNLDLEITDEGLLYRPHTEPVPTERPKWLPDPEEPT